MSDARTAANRKRLIARLIVFAVLIAFALVKPKVDAWLAANPLPGTEQAAQSTAWNDSTAADSPATNSADDNDADSATEVGDVAGVPTESSDVSNHRNSKASADAGETVARTSADSGSSKANPTATSSGSRPTADKSQAGTSSKATSNDSRSKPSGQSTSNTGTDSKSDRLNPSRSSDANSGKRSTASSAAENRPAKDPPGKLSLVAGTRDEFRSTAGLVYVRGSEDGHRLKHVLKHAEDNLDKPVHGVFDGDRDQILAWIDIAYTKGKQGGKGVRVEKQSGRVVYTVDLGEKIGVVGGQVGDRKGNPPCRFLRLVVQNGNEVVTAYPSQSL